jgi:hypothetical protein
VKEVKEDPVSFRVSLNRQEVEEARKVMPIIRLSRPEIYREFYSFTGGDESKPCCFKDHSNEAPC